MEFVALGDTIYTEADPDGPGGNMPNDTAFSHLLGRFDSFAILDSVLRGQLDSSVPGLVVFTTGAFDPTSSQYGRGATPDSAILMHWTISDRGPSFVEDTARAALALCSLR